MFSQIKGQKRALFILSKIISKGRISGGYLFYGPQGVGKFGAALDFAMAINCQNENPPCRKCNSCQKFISLNHPDLNYIFPSPNLEYSVGGGVKNVKFLKELESYKKNKINTPYNEFLFSTNALIRIDAVHMLQHRINLSPNEAKYKICIIEDCDKMNISASNAFLKTLEEPPEDTIIIMITTNINDLLPTIVSRCQKIQFIRLPHTLIEDQIMKSSNISQVDAKVYSRIADGNMEKALRMANLGNIASRDISEKILEAAILGDDCEFLSSFKNRIPQSQNYLSEIISYLIVWLSDIFMFSHDPSRILNIDKTETIEQLYHKAPQLEQNIPQIIEYLEKIKGYLKNNINASITLNAIYSKIRNYV